MVIDKFDYGFAVDWMRKDLKIAMEEAKRNGSPVSGPSGVTSAFCLITIQGGGSGGSMRITNPLLLMLN